MDDAATENLMTLKAIDDAFAGQVGKLFAVLTTQKPMEANYKAFQAGLEIAIEARRTIRLSLELRK